MRPRRAAASGDVLLYAARAAPDDGAADEGSVAFVEDREASRDGFGGGAPAGDVGVIFFEDREASRDGVAPPAGGADDAESDDDLL